MREYNANSNIEGNVTDTEEFDYEQVVVQKNNISNTITVMTLAEYNCIIETVVEDI